MESLGDGESEGWAVRKMDSQEEGESERQTVGERERVRERESKRAGQSRRERERESGRWSVRKMDHMPRTFSMSHLTGVLSPFFGTSTEHVGSDLPRVHLSALLI